MATLCDFEGASAYLGRGGNTNAATSKAHELTWAEGRTRKWRHLGNIDGARAYLGRGGCANVATLW